MNDLLQGLKPNERRGSKPRCHLLTYGSPEKVANNLNQLIMPFGSISPNDCWMPQGFDDLEEAQLHKESRLLDAGIAKQLREWWLAADSPNAKTPNIDIASTCTIENKPGLLLVEAGGIEAHVGVEAPGDGAVDDGLLLLL